MKTSSQSRTNQHVIHRLNSTPGDTVLGYLATGSGLHPIRMRRSVVRSLLREAGRENPAFCRLVVRLGVAAVLPVSMPVPEWFDEGGGECVDE